MAYAEDFLIQWETLREEIVQSMRFQVEQYSTLRFAEVNKLLQTKAKRWSSRINAEGRWMADITDVQCRQAVLDALNRLTLKEVPIETHSNRLALGVGAGGLVAGAMIGNMLPFGVPAAAIGGLCGGAIGFQIANSNTRRKRTESLEKALLEYRAQIDEMGERIADIWRRYEGSGN